VGLPCGVHPSQYAVRALYAKADDLGAAALTVLTSDARNSWVAMLKQGATMTMEMWNADEKPNLTWSHPWATGPAYIIASYLFGINAIVPGFARVGITPSVGSLTSGQYTQRTARGDITVRFQNSAANGQFQLTVTLPAGVTAEVGTPAAATVTADGLTSMHALVADNEIVRDTRITLRRHAMVTVGPGGLHTFVSSTVTSTL